MSALAKSSLETNKVIHQGITSISVNARVDYILRFSKQAVLVVDENGEESASVGHQFLGQLSETHNIAFFSASSQLNNIQQRCRIIEQLFPNKVFDPEQSLAVSVVNLLNESPQRIAIVLGNAQFSSLQVIHELAQLAVIAKKANLSIDVVMFGDYKAGEIVKNAKDLFNGKLSILSAESAQLIPINSSLFSPSAHPVFSYLVNKWLWAFVGLICISIGSVYWLYQKDSFVFSKISGKNTVQKHQELQSIKKSLQAIDQNLLASNLSTRATANDIYQAIIGINVRQPAKANTQDVLTALQVSNAKTTYNDIEENIAVNSNAKAQISELKSEALTNPQTTEVEISNDELISTEQIPTVVDENKTHSNVVVNPLAKPIKLDESTTQLLNNEAVAQGNYYRQFKDGYAIQISGFTQEMIMEQFINEHPQLRFEQYKRLLNDEMMIVLTSQRYATRAEAESAMKALPATISARQPWIKSISAINNEINAFERSQ
ncbi:hypothetical protein [Thalassotalea ganghwensis]